MSSFLPWLLTCVFAVLAATGWWKVLDPSPQKKLVVDDALWQKVEQEVAAEQRTVVGQSAAVAQTSPAAQQCLDNPEVKRSLRSQAENLAQRLFQEKQEEHQQERIERARGRMDGMESFFSNAVNSYGETFEVEESVLSELHAIVEDGFVRQREILDQMENGEIGRREHWKLRREAHEDGKAAVADLLGEDGAKDFRAILEEEGERARQEEGGRGGPPR